MIAMPPGISFSDQLRRAVATSQFSQYRIAKELGVAESTISRFMSGGGLLLKHIDALVKLLDLRIAIHPTHKRAAPRRIRREY